MRIQTEENKDQKDGAYHEMSLHFEFLQKDWQCEEGRGELERAKERAKERTWSKPRRKKRSTDIPSFSKTTLAATDAIIQKLQIHREMRSPANEQTKNVHRSTRVKRVTWGKKEGEMLFFEDRFFDGQVRCRPLLNSFNSILGKQRNTKAKEWGCTARNPPHKKEKTQQHHKLYNRKKKKAISSGSNHHEELNAGA